MSSDTDVCTHVCTHCNSPVEYFVYFLDGDWKCVADSWELSSWEPQCLKSARAVAKRYRVAGVPAIVSRNGDY